MEFRLHPGLGLGLVNVGLNRPPVRGRGQLAGKQGGKDESQPGGE